MFRLKNSVWTFVVTSLIFFAIHSTDCLTKPSSVKLVNNGYEGVVVAIRDDVPESEHLIQEIKGTLINASTYLYQATRQRAFFRNVTVLLPQTWSNNFSTVSPENSTYEAADVIVTPVDPDLANRSTVPPPPFCKHFEGCGKQAAFIHFSSEFLTRNITRDYYGDIGRLLIHEWGHYRWGLFNEYPDETADPTSEEFFYSPSENEFKATRCSSDWESENLVFDNATRSYRKCVGNQSVGYEDGCFSVPTSNQTNVTGSIMYGYTHIEQITQFCDNDETTPSNLHVTEAPNKHNRLCDTRSSWEIMRQHPDFSDGNNQASNLSEVDITPTIVLAKASPLRLVLVLDTSGSMNTNNRIRKQATLSQNFLLTGLVDGMSVGIVSFSRNGRILSSLVEIDSDETKRTLASKIPTEADGGTCIGCGLEMALEILQENNQRAEGGVVLLITDGEDSTQVERRKTEEMKQEYEEKKVKIHGVAFGKNADNVIPELASTTGGNFFLQTDDIGSTGLHDAFSTTVEGQSQIGARSLQLYTESLNISKEGNFSGRIWIDASIGNKTKFEFIHFYGDGKTAVIEVNITSPSNELITETSPEYKEELEYGFVIVEINGTAESGWWRYNVKPNFRDVGEVLTTISSLPSSDGSGIILATAEMSTTVTNVNNGEFISIFADVRKGFYPVLNCIVTAIVERPNDSPFELQLLDNGAGTDVTAGDGIYSRYFTGFSEVGYYGVKILVTNYGEDATIETTSGPTFSRAQLYVEPQDLLSDNISKLEEDLLLLPGEAPTPGTLRAPSFMRQTSGGSNRVTSLPNDEDFLPPCKINDLRVASTSYNDSTVTLTFTAPGGDLDYGKADYYVFQSSTTGTYDEIINSAPEISDENFIQGNSSSPANFGSAETFVVNVTFPENSAVSTFYFVTRAYDKAGNGGEASNLVQATLRKYIPSSESIPEPSMTTEMMTSTHTSSTYTKVTTNSKSPGEPIKSSDGILLIVLITVSVGLFIFIIIFVTVYILQKIVMRNRRRQLWKDHTSDENWRVEEHTYDNELDFDEPMFEMNPIDRATSVYSQASTDGVVQEPIISPQIYDESTLEGYGNYYTQQDDVESGEFPSSYDNSGYYPHYALSQYVLEDERGSSYTRQNGSNYFLPYVTRRKYDPSFDMNNIPGQYF